MFSGIIEYTGTVKNVRKEGTNLHFSIAAPFAHELKVDQSIAHDGICLTVVAIEDSSYTVTAIMETVQRTNVQQWKEGTLVNLERCLRVGDRLDGHIVQGHVDTTALCTLRQDLQGSWKFGFEYDPHSAHITVEKGSICINGVSLTVVDSTEHYFSVCIIPYTMEHTNFSMLHPGDRVNLEFDVMGKYIARIMELRT